LFFSEESHSRRLEVAARRAALTEEDVMSDVQSTETKSPKAKANKAAKPAKGKAKKTAKPPARSYRLSLSAVEKAKAAIDGIENIITVAPTNASGDNVSTSLRTQRRAALVGLRALVATLRVKVKAVRKLREKSFV
jgi:hypothetical protein